MSANASIGDSNSKLRKYHYKIIVNQILWNYEHMNYANTLKLMYLFGNDLLMNCSMKYLYNQTQLDIKYNIFNICNKCETLKNNVIVVFN